MLLIVQPWLKILLNILFPKIMPDNAKEYAFDVIEFTIRANESCLDKFEIRKTLMKVLKLN